MFGHRAKPAPQMAQAVQLFERGQPAQAAALCRQIVQAQPGHAGAWQLLGITQIMAGQPGEAEPALRQALALDERNTRTLCLLGVACSQQDRADEAIAFFDRALALDPNQPGIWYDRGNTLYALGRDDEAVQSFDRALKLEPRLADAWLNRGHALLRLERPQQAIASYESGLDLAPGHAKLWSSLAEALVLVHRMPDALACLEKALAIDDSNVDVWISMGDVLRVLGRSDLALERYDKALQLNPGIPHLWTHRALAFKELRRLDESVEALKRARELAPGDLAIAYILMSQLQHLARWHELEALWPEVLQHVRSGDFAQDSFAMLSHPHATAHDLLLAGAGYAALVRGGTTPVQRAPAANASAPRRLRVGYLSADFRDHPLSLLMVGVFEAHDKTRFETFGLSIYPQPAAGPMRTRLQGAFDQFIDLHAVGNAEAVARIAQLQLDILVDLTGYTSFCRPGIVVRRPAPIQVSYLGFPATTGMAEIDYILGDRWVTPLGSAGEFSEKIIRLPESFQANDDQRPGGAKTPSRQELGLPEHGFVFCCHNNIYKINPGMFDIWMRLLAQVPGSVLWLVADSPETDANLRRQAEARGVAGERLVFARRAPYVKYLAQYRQADLFLDTLPFNAGTTASDALWAGLPVLTQLGHSFAGRMAASLLDAVGLPELITRDAAAYEQMALKLATTPELLRELRERLERHRATSPLFNTARFTQHLERAYEMIWARHVQGLPPAEIDVPALEAPGLSAAPASP